MRRASWRARRVCHELGDQRGELAHCRVERQRGEHRKTAARPTTRWRKCAHGCQRSLSQRRSCTDHLGIELPPLRSLAARRRRRASARPSSYRSSRTCSLPSFIPRFLTVSRSRRPPSSMTTTCCEPYRVRVDRLHSRPPRERQARLAGLGEAHDGAAS